MIEGWVHVVGSAAAATKSRSRFPSLHAQSDRDIGEDGRARLHFDVKGLAALVARDRRSSTRLQSAQARLDRRVDGLSHHRDARNRDSAEWQADLPARRLRFMRRRPIAPAAPIPTRMRKHCWAGRRNWAVTIVRLAHYPHDETMLRAADRMGLLVWSENPVYWALAVRQSESTGKGGAATRRGDQHLAQSCRHHSMVDGE